MYDTLYDDKLAGDISQEKYKQKHQEFLTRLAELEDKLANVDEDQLDEYKEGVSIIELTQQAAGIFADENESNDKKREVLTKLCEDIRLEGKTVSVTLTKMAQAIARQSHDSGLFADQLNQANQTGIIKLINSSKKVLKQLHNPFWLALLVYIVLYCLFIDANSTDEITFRPNTVGAPVDLFEEWDLGFHATCRISFDDTDDLSDRPLGRN